MLFSAENKILSVKIFILPPILIPGAAAVLRLPHSYVSSYAKL